MFLLLALIFRLLLSLSAVVAGAFARGAGIPAAVAAATFVAAVVVSVPAWRHGHFAADDRGDSSWQCSATAFCSAVLRAVDRRGCANSAAAPVERVGLEPLGGGRPVSTVVGCDPFGC